MVYFPSTSELHFVNWAFYGQLMTITRGFQTLDIFFWNCVIKLNPIFCAQNLVGLQIILFVYRKASLEFSRNVFLFFFNSLKMSALGLNGRSLSDSSIRDETGGRWVRPILSEVQVSIVNRYVNGTRVFVWIPEKVFPVECFANLSESRQRFCICQRILPTHLAKAFCKSILKKLFAKAFCKDIKRKRFRTNSWMWTV